MEVNLGLHMNNMKMTAGLKKAEIYLYLTK